MPRPCEAAIGYRLTPASKNRQPPDVGIETIRFIRHREGRFSREPQMFGNLRYPPASGQRAHLP